MAQTIDIEKFLAKAKQDFLDSCGDRMANIDSTLDRLFNGKAKPGAEWEACFHELQREVHSLKGTAGSFGFMTVTHIAHRLEDYIEAAEKFETKELRDIERHVGAMRDILEKGVNPGEADTETILKSLPTHAKTAPRQERSALLVMPKNLQRRIMGRELAESGWRTVFADKGLEAIGLALANPPDLVIASQELADVSGIELAWMLRAVKALKSCRFVLATAHDPARDKLDPLPEGAATIAKGNKFAAELKERLAGWRLTTT